MKLQNTQFLSRSFTHVSFYPQSEQLIKKWTKCAMYSPYELLKFTTYLILAYKVLKMPNFHQEVSHAPHFAQSMDDLLKKWIKCAIYSPRWSSKFNNLSWFMNPPKRNCNFRFHESTWTIKFIIIMFQLWGFYGSVCGLRGLFVLV